MQPVGHIITWRVPTRVSLDSLRTALQEAGIDDALVGDLHPRHALARALREMAAGQPRIVRRLPKDADDRPRMQLTREYLREVGLEYEREAVLTLDSTRVLGDDAAIVAEAQRLLEEHTHQRLTSDLTRLVQRIVIGAGTDLIPVREQGGAYFVPSGTTVVGQLAVVLERISGKLSMFAVTLGHGSDQSVADTLAEYLVGQIAEFRQSIAELSPDSRSDVQARRTARIGELRQRLEGYRSLLSASADRVSAELDQAQDELLGRLQQGMLV